MEQKYKPLQLIYNHFHLFCSLDACSTRNSVISPSQNLEIKYLNIFAPLFLVNLENMIFSTFYSIKICKSDVTIIMMIYKIIQINNKISMFPYIHHRAQQQIMASLNIQIITILLMIRQSPKNMKSVKWSTLFQIRSLHLY